MIEDIISLGTIVVFLASFLLAIIAYNSVSRPKHSPPGPPLLPFIGNLHLILRSDTRNFYSELRKKYGDIFSLTVGFSHWIVINGYEMLKETFVRNGEFTSNRPDLIPWTFKGENIGIVIQSGQQWKENRKFALKQLRHVGVGSIDIEQRIQREIVFHISAIQSLNGQSFDIKHLQQRSILNVITSILFNERSNGEHSSLESLTHVFEDEVNSKVDLLLLSYPFLARIPWLRQIREKFSVERVVLKGIYEEHVASFEKEVIRDITDAYIQEQRGGGGGKDNTITGRRVCLGESFARSSIFLFLTAMVQRFVFLPETENEMPGLECALGEFLHRPKPFKLRAVSFDMP